MYLTLKRTLTAIGCFVPLAFLLFTAGLMVGGAIFGAVAGSQNPENAFEAGQRAGEEFGATYGSLVLLAAILLAGGIAVAISFGGLFPWCRRKAATQPPPLPR